MSCMSAGPARQGLERAITECLRRLDALDAEVEAHPERLQELLAAQSHELDLLRAVGRALRELARQPDTREPSG